MKRVILILAVSVSLTTALAACASARDIRTDRARCAELPAPCPRVASPDELLAPNTMMPSDFRDSYVETIWIFDADFEDLEGDNAGWTTFDASGTLAQTNYWHHDTIRLTEEYLGESTWWCGTYNQCWRQPRGYGNDWTQILERNMTEIGSSSNPGDLVELEFDQRYAMECYDDPWGDYGCVDVSDDDGATWTTIAMYTNTEPWPGTPHDWDDPADGHVTLDLSAYAGQPIRLRYRFKSDESYSPLDQYDNSQHSMRDGAWQLDNITVEVNGAPVFYDDCESGNMDWIHDDQETSGQTGVVFWRGQYGIDFVTGRTCVCDDRPVGSWMYAAVDPFTSKVVDHQDAWLVSPPIDVSGARKLVGQYEMWFDCPGTAGDAYNVLLGSSDLYECVTDPAGFISTSWTGWYGGPYWGVFNEDWTMYAPYDWLAIRFDLVNEEPGEEPHMAGIFLDRVRVGMSVGDPGTTFQFNPPFVYNDWFEDDLWEALLDSMRVGIIDDHGIASAFVVASNDGGETWEAYECVKENPGNPFDIWWLAPPPANQMVPGSEILYYFEATDALGNVATEPLGAPAVRYAFRILPITASTADPGLLVVDKSLHLVTGEDRSRRWPGYYYLDALEILGFEFDLYRPTWAGVPDLEYGGGPDTVGMKYYDTQIWFAYNLGTNAILRWDQRNLIEWLAQSTEGRERNLLLTGTNIGRALMGEAAQETLGFYTTWLASDYLADGVGVCEIDSIPGLIDRAGGFEFMTHEDAECILAGGCPSVQAFDVIDARSGVVGNDVVADYEREDLSTVPAGVAYTHPTMGYQTVNLGFGLESMMDGTNPDNPGNYTPEGYYHTGIADRVDLLANIMAYFGLSPDVPGTDVAEGGIENTLSHAHPNPFNPVTRIDYSVREAGPVAIEIYSVAGRVVRRLLHAEVEAGASGSVVWDGTNETGERCASGVYFYRIVAPGFTASRRMVLLK